jgi:hypothetical protein
MHCQFLTGISNDAVLLVFDYLCEDRSQPPFMLSSPKEASLNRAYG